MKYLNLDRGVKHAAGLGLSVLLLSAAFVRTGAASAQSYQLPGSQTSEEPTEDPGVDPAFIESKTGSRTAEAVLRKWPKAARITAVDMIAKYGEPSHSTKGALVWIHNNPWRRTVVYVPHSLGKRSNDFVEQTIAYRVPVEKAGELKRFDARLEVNEVRGELSARTESESSNFLALNVADEIIAGERSVENARNFYERTESLSKAGKSSPYTERFLFPNRNGMRIDERNVPPYDWMMIP
jgi:hypothetical protein